MQTSAVLVCPMPCWVPACFHTPCTPKNLEQCNQLAPRWLPLLLCLSYAQAAAQVRSSKRFALEHAHSAGERSVLHGACTCME